MKSLPRKPGARAGVFDILDYLADMAEFLGDSAVALLHGQRTLMTQSSDLQGGLDRNTASTSAAAAAINAEIAQLKTAIDALSTNQAPTQAQLDQLNASSDALDAATAALAADDAPASNA